MAGFGDQGNEFLGHIKGGVSIAEQSYYQLLEVTHCQ
jgi:hypothetical protein